MSFELFRQDPSAYAVLFIISLVITVLSYALLPLAIALTRGKPITKKKYRGICYGLNIAVFIIFIVINSEDGGVVNAAPYFLWTTLFSVLGIKILNSKGVIDEENLKCDADENENNDEKGGTAMSLSLENENFYDNGVALNDANLESGAPMSKQPDISNSQQVIDSSPDENKPKKYCSCCGSAIDNESKKCTGCGKQYFKGIRFNKFSITVIILSLVIVLLAVLCVVQYIKVRDMKELISNNQITINRLQRENDALNLQIAFDDELSEFVDEHVVFIEDDGTDLYHKFDCYKFVGNRFWVYNTEKAEQFGYTPCSYCH